MQAGLHPAAAARGFPFRAGPLIVAVLIWNLLLGLEFFSRAGFAGFPGPLSFAAVALLFVASIAALRLPTFQSILLRPGRGVGEVRPVFLLLATVSSLMTLVFGIMLIVGSSLEPRANKTLLATPALPLLSMLAFTQTLAVLPALAPRAGLPELRR